MPTVVPQNVTIKPGLPRAYWDRRRAVKTGPWPSLAYGCPMFPDSFNAFPVLITFWSRESWVTIYKRHRKSRQRVFANWWRVVTGGHVTTQAKPSVIFHCAPKRNNRGFLLTMVAVTGRVVVTLVGGGGGGPVSNISWAHTKTGTVEIILYKSRTSLHTEKTCYPLAEY